MKSTIFLFLCAIVLWAQEVQDSSTATVESTTVQDSAGSAETADSTVTESAPATGLQIDGYPDSMSVSVDSVFKGYSPLHIADLTAGEHTVVLKKSGYYGKKLTVTIGDSLTTIADTLREPATLTVQTTPAEALLFLNRKKQDKTPITVEKLRPDTYNLVLLKSGYKQFDTTITLESGASDTLHLALISTSPLPESTTVATATTTTAVQPKQSTVQEKSETASQSVNLDKKRVFKIVGTALFTLLLTFVVFSEVSGGE